MEGSGNRVSPALENSSLKGTLTRKVTQTFKLPGAEISRKSIMIPNGGRLPEKLIRRESFSMVHVKKYPYTKNSLNCIPLTSKIRQ